MASLTDSKPGRFVLLAVLALVVVATSLFAFAGEPLANTDDAFIVLVYARHLLAGAGLVWNADPVEGFTSPLDLLLKTAGTAVTTDPIKMAFSLTLMFHAGCALNALAALVLVQVAQTASGSADKLRWMGRWPLSMSDYACDRAFAGWLSRAARDLPIAQTDFQQVKLLADELHVVDLRGLNDEQIAHLPWPKRNRWGKYDHDLGVSVNAPIWIWGRKLKTPEPISDYSMERLLADAELMTYFTAWRDEPAMAGTAAGRGIHAAYLPASVQVCGDYRNFFVRKDVAARLAAAGAKIGVSSGAPGS